MAALPALVLADEEAPPSKQVLRTALQWMQSSDPDRRQAAYRSVHLLGKEALPPFEKALRAALRYHERRLADALSSRNRQGNPYAELVSVCEELRSERSRVDALVRVDYQKNAAKIDEVRTEFSSLEALYKKATRLAATDTTRIDQEIENVTAALVEIHDQLARFEGQTAEEAAEITEEERRKDALEQSFDGHSYLQAARDLGEMRSEVARLAATETHNDSCTWASGAQKDFARIINYERVVLGLGPLRLDEQLSAAATGHSQDMKALGFFSHTSPVEGKNSFSDRARRAGFKGSPAGECIAAGYGSAAAAYRGWFYSDGHRFIMVARGPNVLGIGPVGSHWTLVTGRQ